MHDYPEPGETDVLQEPPVPLSEPPVPLSEDEAGPPTDASFMNLLYFFSYNLPNAWQIALDPTITYDARATSGNKWNVPVGLSVAKTTLLGKMPVKIQLGFEYSVVSQDAYGEQAKLVLEVIPVIPALIRRSILGGK